MLEEAACLFPATHPQNNHTETVIIKSLHGLLALASYWLAFIHLNLTNFYQSGYSHVAVAYQQGSGMSVSDGSYMAFS